MSNEFNEHPPLGPPHLIHIILHSIFLSNPNRPIPHHYSISLLTNHSKVNAFVSLSFNCFFLAICTTHHFIPIRNFELKFRSVMLYYETPTFLFLIYIFFFNLGFGEDLIFCHFLGNLSILIPYFCS